MTYVAFEMLCFLVLYQDLLIIKISITIPAPRLQLLLLLATHNGALPTKQKGKKEEAGETKRKRALNFPTQRLPPRPTGNRHKMADTLGRGSASRRALRREAGPGQGGSQRADRPPGWVGTRGRHLVDLGGPARLGGRCLLVPVRLLPAGFF